MSLSRYAKKRDANEAGIIAALRKYGVKVWQIDRPCDLICHFMGIVTLLEAKQGKGKLTPDQQKLADAGIITVVRNEAEAIFAVTGYTVGRFRG